jgi:hypothetical protein
VLRFFVDFFEFVKQTSKMTEVIFVHALNINLLFVFSHFRKKLDILILLASFFRKFENVLWVASLIPSGRLSLVKYPVLIKPNTYIYYCKTQSICRGHYENLEYITK